MALSPIGKYERVDVLGYGATGIVYLAWDSLLRKQVALKEINVQAGDMERFLEEARLLDRLNHRNIVQVHSVDRVDGKILIAMEYVPGINLQELLRQQGKLPVRQALDIAIQVLDALDYAHRNHIVHRDIKPGNILISKDGVVKLVDFGLATILGTGSYAGGAGTYVYMAPEDFEEEERSDHRSDLWAVGVTLYEMVTGHRPFNATNPKNPFSWQEAVQKQQPPPLQQYVPDAPSALQTVIEHALAKRKEDRYPTAGEFAQALRRVQAMLPDAGEETLAFVSSQAYGVQQRRKPSARGSPESARSAIAKVEPQQVLLGPVRQGERCAARVVVRSTNRKPLDARLMSHPGWLYVHPTIIQRKQQVLTLTADTGMVSTQGTLSDVVQFVSGEHRISIPVQLEVLPPRPQFQQVAYWYVPLFVACLVPLFTVILGSNNWSLWMPIGLELSGLLGAMLTLITIGAELRSGERMAAVLLMLTGLSATGTYLGVLGDPQNHPQGRVAIDLLTIMGSVLLLQVFSTRRWKWWAWVLVGLSLGLSGVITSVYSEQVRASLPVAYARTVSHAVTPRQRSSVKSSQTTPEGRIFPYPRSSEGRRLLTEGKTRLPGALDVELRRLRESRKNQLAGNERYRMERLESLEQLKKEIQRSREEVRKSLERLREETRKSLEQELKELRKSLRDSKRLFDNVQRVQWYR